MKSKPNLIKEKLNQYSRDWYAKQPKELLNAKRRAYYEKHKDHIRAYQNKWKAIDYKINGDKMRKYQREYQIENYNKTYKRITGYSEYVTNQKK